MNEIRQQINDAIEHRIGIDMSKYNENSKLQYDLGIDSLDIVELVGILEEQFNISIQTVDIKRMYILDDLYKRVETEVNARKKTLLG